MTADEVSAAILGPRTPPSQVERERPPAAHTAFACVLWVWVWPSHASTALVKAPPCALHCTALHSPLFVLPVLSVHCMLPLGGGTRLQLSGPNTGQDCVFGPSRRGCVYFLLVKNVSSKQYHFWRKSFLFRDPFRRFLLSARKFSKCQRLS